MDPWHRQMSNLISNSQGLPTPLDSLHLGGMAQATFKSSQEVINERKKIFDEISLKIRLDEIRRQKAWAPLDLVGILGNVVGLGASIRRTTGEQSCQILVIFGC